MRNFKEEYKKLNPEQRTAVDTIDGPVLVVAGPGTGKTQLLSMRVANILKTTDTDASSILCLTFTNKAAINMRQRLLSLTDGVANDVMIKTFHSFAAELMNMYPDHFWNGAKLSTAPDTTQIEIIQNILSELPISNPLALRFAGKFTATSTVQNGLRLAKEAGLTPTKLRKIIHANLAYINRVEPQIVDILSVTLSYKKLPQLSEQIHKIEVQETDPDMRPLLSLSSVIIDSLNEAIRRDSDTGKTLHVGKWKRRFIQTVDGQKGMFDERKRNEWWLELSDVYEKYRTELHQRGYYDYSDMIIEVITQLENNPDMRADVQERFLYVLIDEFQDTNAAQLKLAHLIADHHANNNKPNLMAVGDDDQSIYKFNGAELNNMLMFKQNYPDTSLIVLTDNYRSSQAILDTASKIIRKASDRLVLRDPSIKKELWAKNPPTTNGNIELRCYQTKEQELSDLAESIAQQRRNSSESIAVLARGHSSLRQLSALLLQLGTPISYEEQSNILDHQAVIQVHTLASLLIAINEGDVQAVDAHLAQTLKHPMWQLKPKLLWSLATSTYRKAHWLDYMLASNDEKLKTIATWLLWLAKESAHQSLKVTIEYILGLRAGEIMTSPLREYFITKHTITTDYVHALSAIRILQELVTDFARLSNKPTLRDYVNFVQLTIDNEEVIADESSFVSGDNAVELLTVHKAKGLEFDTVYIIDAVDNNWRPSRGGKKPPANLPLQPNGDDQDDYIRLMFVAATRAKQALIISTYTEDALGKETMPTPILHEVISITNIGPIPEDKLIQVLEEQITWPSLSVDDARQNLRSRLETYSLSATGLLDFLDISKGGPNYFLERHLLCLPTEQTANMAFGTAIHSALEYAQILINSDSFAIGKVQSHYIRVLAEQYLTQQEQTRYQEHGAQLLEKLFESDTFWLGKGSLPEQRINDIVIGEASINGTLDRIDIKDTHLTIVDYKTGKPLSSLQTKEQAKAIKAWRHRNQLVFYSLLIRNSRRFRAIKSISAQMMYVEAASAKELIREYTASEEELERMQMLITAIWPRIHSLELPDITGYSPTHEGITKFENDLIAGK